jgi:hypothetical protein
MTRGEAPHWLDYDPVTLAVLVIGIGMMEIAAKADGGCNVLEGCAEPEIDPATATQYSIIEIQASENALQS